jgi:DNA-binding NtrC family response regulator
MNEGKTDLSVLIVDDEPVVRHLLKSLLSKEGYELIAEVETGEACLEALANRRFDVVLLDKNLPGIGGLEVLEQTRDLRPGTQFLIITAYGSLDSALKALELGAQGYLTKPFGKIETVIAQVRDAAERAHAHRRIAEIFEQVRVRIQSLAEPPQAAGLLELLDEIERLQARIARPLPAQNDS